MNLTSVTDDETARTDPECAAQRAAHLAILGAKTVLELCVGPSLETLERAYRARGMQVVGNDIDPRWRSYYRRGTWLVGDALKIDWSGFDAVVFAPPLTAGCSGRREDSLQIDDVVPSYADFLDRGALAGYRGIRTLVLPARSLATNTDRNQLHRLLYQARQYGRVEGPIALWAGPRQIRKYLDIYITDAGP